MLRRIGANLFSSLVRNTNATDNLLLTRSVCSTSYKASLADFIDTKDNWGVSTIKVGRPWKKSELRIKSSTDLHKLWYVLLKERNQVMSMMQLYEDASELVPNPERLEKVEESMENLLDVVTERAKAHEMLEHGKLDMPSEVDTISEIGLPRTRITTEHHLPYYMNKTFHRSSIKLRRHKLFAFTSRYEEKKHNRAMAKRYEENERLRKLKKAFPKADIEFDPKMKRV